jgi:hypothetical protein
MEERIEALEAENARLNHDVSKKDAAVDEAAAMIVKLEAQVRILEKQIVQRLDGAGDGYYGLRSDPLDLSANMATPKLRMSDLAKFEDDAKAVYRMPSFLSEHSENTENLRNVYLGIRGSLLSLSKPHERSGDGDHGHLRGLTSPSLSVLSESSFMSIYGEKGSQDRAPLPLLDDSSGYDGSPPDDRPATKPNSAEADKATRDRIVTPTRLPRSNSISRTTGPGQFQSITDILDQGSPLQRLERLDRTFSLRTDTSKISGSEKDRTMSLRTDSFQTSNIENDVDSGYTRKPRSQSRTKEEKREALRRVNTDGHAIRLHDHGLPPTPDTISTSTLRHYKNSKDTLSNEQGITDQRSFLALSEATGISNGEKPLAAQSNGYPVPQPPSITAFNSRREFQGSSYFDNRLPPLQRPRSAGETTISHRRGNDWDTDSDFEDEVHSVASTDDIWLREGANYARHGQGGGRISPDLFGFPPSAKGWNAGAMFGNGDRSFGSGPTQRSNPIDDLLPVQQALFSSGGPPPPPNRRSSLHARTGSSRGSGSETPRNPGPANGKLRKSPERKTGHARRNSDEIAPRSASQSQVPTPQEQKRVKDNHYPPKSGQITRGRGLNSLFRRSIGSGSGITESAPSSATEPTFAAATTKSGAIGVPSWVHRGSALDDDRASATPPPIMRNRVPGRRGSFDGESGGVMLSSYQPLTPVTPATTFQSYNTGNGGTPATPTNNAAPAQSSNSGPTLSKRKWLPGFGRTTSLRNRAG